MAGLLDVERGQHRGLLGVDGGDARDRRRPIDADAVTLNPAQLCQGPLRAELALGQLQAMPHDAVNDQGHEAQHGARADALRQLVVHRCDVDLGLEDPETPLDVDLRLPALHHFLWRQVGHVGGQQQLAVHQSDCACAAPSTV